MIATILQSNATFHAVLYNEKKVMQGCAKMLEMKNFGSIDVLGYSTPKELQDYLKQYSERNGRIKKPQFHLAISCKGHEWTEQELLDFAHEYLDEMGYGNAGQPLLIYAHHDTDNTHLHVISSRVAPDGKKINDSQERLRSQRAIEKLLGKNIKKKAEADVKSAMSFDFSDLRQFKSILEAMNYECFEAGEDDRRCLCVKKGGMIQTRIPLYDIREKWEKNNFNRMPDVAERMKWKEILKKYRDMNSGRPGLEKDMHSLFGVKFVWLGNKDNPYGYQLVDFNNKKVYDGYKILNINKLTRFMTPEEHGKQIEVLIDKCLEENPYMSTVDLNRRLRRLGGYVKKDCYLYGNRRVPLDALIKNTLDRNNKIAWRQSFKPASDAEIRIVCKLTNYSSPDVLKVVPAISGKYKQKELSELYPLLTINDPDEKIRLFRASGYIAVKSEDGLFFLNMDRKVILDMSKSGLPEEMYTGLFKKSASDTEITSGQTPQKQIGKGIRMPAHGNGSYRTGQNREWEVGKRGKDRDDLDWNQDQGLSY